MKNAPEYQKHIYKVNEVSGYFEKILAPVGFIKLPNEFKLEPPQRDDYKTKNVRFVARSRMKDGKTSLHTGLIETGFERCFYGDHFHPNEKVKNSFCLFCFNHTSSEITVYYFNHFSLFPKHREKFISEFLNSVL